MHLGSNDKAFFRQNIFPFDCEFMVFPETIPTVSDGESGEYHCWNWCVSEAGRGRSNSMDCMWQVFLLTHALSLLFLTLWSQVRPFPGHMGRLFPVAVPGLQSPPRGKVSISYFLPLLDTF